MCGPVFLHPAADGRLVEPVFTGHLGDRPIRLDHQSRYLVTKLGLVFRIFPSQFLDSFPDRTLFGPQSGKRRHLQITGLLDAGLPTRIIKELLPCLDKPQTIYVPDVTPEMIATLRREQARLSERIECLTRNKDAIADYLDKVLSVKSANNEISATS